MSTFFNAKSSQMASHTPDLSSKSNSHYEYTMIQQPQTVSRQYSKQRQSEQSQIDTPIAEKFIDQFQVSSEAQQGFDLHKIQKSLQESINQGYQQLLDTLTQIQSSFSSTEDQIICNNIIKNLELMQSLVSNFRDILMSKRSVDDESVYEQCMTTLGDILSKFMQMTPVNKMQKIVDEQLMEALVLNTAHHSGSIRKISRSCIANYVRQYKDLKPILTAFKEYGIRQNQDSTSQQWIILILPNLMNLDQTVISKECAEFTDLIRALHYLSANNEDQESDICKSCNKVISEMLKRFPQFESIYKMINEQYKPLVRDESKKNIVKLSQTTKQKSLETVFGFLEQSIFQRMIQQNNNLDKIKAFEEAFTSLQLFKSNQQVKYAELLQFLTNFLGENSSSQQAPLNHSCLKIINLTLNQTFQKNFNIARLTSIVVNKLLDTNKNVRVEAQTYFQNLQKMMGYKAYVNLIINFIENFCNQQQQQTIQMTVHQQSSMIDALLNLVHSCSIKLKAKDDLDLKQLIQILDKVWQQDTSHEQKIIDILHILSGSVIGQKEIISQTKFLFNEEFHAKFEERLGISIETLRRNLSIQSNITIDKLDTKEQQLLKKKQLMLPNINHQQSHSPMKSSMNSQKGTAQGQRKNLEIYQSTQNLQSHENSSSAKNGNPGFKLRLQQQPVQVNRYNSGDFNNVPNSPFTATTMSSISDRLQLVKKARSDQPDEQSNYNSSLSVNTGLSKTKGNSQSHQVLPQISPNQRASNIIEKNLQTKTIATASRNNQSKSLANNEINPNASQGSNGFQTNQITHGTLKRDPSYFQQTNGSLAGSLMDQVSTKTSNHKPGSGNTTKSLRFMRGTVTSLGETSESGQGNKNYLTINELEPLVNPDLEWKLFLGEIKSDNWSRQFEACNTLRKVCKFHMKDIVYAGAKGIQKQTIDTFHEINLQVFQLLLILAQLIKLVDSLRSSVSKQAMITINEMFESLPRQLLEIDLDQIFQVLIKKTVDSNVFMAEEGERALMSMCRNMSEAKVLSALMVQKNNKASEMRCQICRCLSVILIRMKQAQQQKKTASGKVSENERQILQQIGNYLSDASQEVRNQSKIAIQQIVNLYDEFSNREELENIMMQSMNDQTFKKVQDYIESVKTNPYITPLQKQLVNYLNHPMIEQKQQVTEEVCSQVSEEVLEIQATGQTSTAVNDPIYQRFQGVLKDAKKGEVITRFPPEPSGYLHIGHIKAAMLNYHYAKMYEGKMILRFDDTNPMNEKIEFVDNIIRDLKTLEITPDLITYTSDYFDVCKEYMEKMISLGLAYADDTPADRMKEERDKGVESQYRNATPEENLKRFHLMLEGKHDEDKPKEKQAEEKKATKKEDKKKEKEAQAEPQSDWCMRAKIDMQHKVKCLRDPVFYRIKKEPHHRTGTKYKAYPTYDFACPIVDSLENISHCLRTIEYHDRNAMYHWVQEKLGLRKVIIYDYSRLNLVSTVLSKRSLKWFVESGNVEGWNDPRFPTVQGIMRRGLTVEAMKQFMLEQGPSKNTNLMEWDKLWALNKNIIDPIAPRYTAIVKSSAVKLVIENASEEVEAKSVPLHPKNEAIGSKAIICGKTVWIEKDDADSVTEGEKVALRNYGKVEVVKKSDENGVVTLYGKLDPADKDFKKVKVLTWVTADDDTTVEISLVEFGHLISKQKVEENDDVRNLVNTNSRVEYTAIAEGCMRNLKHGQILQLERRGYFFVDQIAFGEKKLRLHYIPDGKMNPMSKLNSQMDPKYTVKGEAASGSKIAANKAEQKKLAGNTNDADAAATEGEKKGPSKKELKKAAKKEQKKANKNPAAQQTQQQEASADSQQTQQTTEENKQQ